MDGTVYQCPDVYTFIQSRLTSSIDPLMKSLNCTMDSLR